ncbi:MAG: hypothetical protein UY28_C0056G0001 [Candidatus Amesbacteria bacterium GW2011_GWB1_48_13]|uniref:Uncharacterized protein n=1 Tax=Candidatus Amesbacteria bacterium GW2011_GWB1_48_13 TaxID=1618362 RepID=A0A0G1XLV2_9BACT|nr:MAG: hypothetical protein UY28_C0056G0001 [Candidatus Amesbacteria bacterium GW2011_GWB1_48_13]
MPAGPQKNKFMTSSSLNTCIRCGKTRIISKTWTEDVEMFFGKSTVIHTETVCPDPDCQKLVNERLQVQREKTESIRLAKEERISRIKNARKLRTQAVKR